MEQEGFFDTGDVSTLSAEGVMSITDRDKDVIKSGGEWISSIEIENEAMGHPEVRPTELPLPPRSCYSTAHPRQAHHTGGGGGSDRYRAPQVGRTAAASGGS